MDGARFDSIARMPAGRQCRRTALCGTGTGVAARNFARQRSEAHRITRDPLCQHTIDGS